MLQMSYQPLHSCDERIDECCPRGDEIEIALDDLFGQTESGPITSDGKGSILDAGFILQGGETVDLNRMGGVADFMVHEVAIAEAMSEDFGDCDIQMREAMGQAGIVRVRCLVGAFTQIGIEYVFVVEKPIRPSMEQMATLLKYYRAAFEHVKIRSQIVAIDKTPHTFIDLWIVEHDGSEVHRYLSSSVPVDSKEIYRALSGQIGKYLEARTCVCLTGFEPCCKD